MNIKLIHLDGKWFVVVNSIAGEFKHDITAQIEQALASEVNQHALKLAQGIRANEIEEMRDAIDGAISALQHFIDS